MTFIGPRREAGTLISAGKVLQSVGDGTWELIDTPTGGGGGSDPTWTAWTPTWNGGTLGNGTIEAEYAVLDGTRIMIRFIFTMGSTSTMPAGFNSFELPSGFTCNWDSRLAGDALDTGNTGYHPCTGMAASGATTLYAAGRSAATFRQGHPFTWADGDSFHLAGCIFGAFA